MSFVKRCLLLLLFAFPASGFSQSDSSVSHLDSLDSKNMVADTLSRNKYDEFNQSTKGAIRTYFILLGSNVKQEFTKPFHMSKKDWGNFGKFTAVALAISFADKPIQQEALKLRNRNTGINDVSKFVTNFGGLYEGFTLAGIGVYSLITKNQKLKTVSLLSTQACITGGAVATVVKFISGRTRPSYYSSGTEAEPKFLGPFSKTSKNADGKTSFSSSFPSGHTTVAFAAATVFAMEYRDRPIVPVIAYTAASLIGVSRITENRHWATDVFVGAALGYLSGRQVVNNYHRYEKKMANGRAKNSMSFNVKYAYGHWEPGIVYHLR